MRLVCAILSSLMAAALAHSVRLIAAEPSTLACSLRLDAAKGAPQSQRSRLMRDYYRNCAAHAKPVLSSSSSKNLLPANKPVITGKATPRRASGGNGGSPTRPSVRAKFGAGKRMGHTQRRRRIQSAIYGPCCEASTPPQTAAPNYENPNIANDTPQQGYAPYQPPARVRSDASSCRPAKVVDASGKDAEVSAFYPWQAIEAQIEGQAKVSCRVGSQGEYTECKVSDEMPEGHGFGDAALKIFKLTTTGSPALCNRDVRLDRFTYDQLTIVSRIIAFKFNK